MVLALGAVFFAFAPPQAAVAAPSSALVNVLTEIGNLSNGDFHRLVTWARSGATPPVFASNSLTNAESDVSQLGNGDRNAVLQWLAGAGRAALYARGVTDSQIGWRNPPSGPAPTPTPNPWRNLPLATGSLDGNVQGNIQVLGGFAAAQRDGRAVIACVSFQNTAAKTASEVDFEFTLTGNEGTVLGKLTLDRKGKFSPNVGIYSYDSLSGWQQGSFGPSSRMDNCVQRKLGTAALPILEARYAGYRVAKVVYDDGTSWTPDQP